MESQELENKYEEKKKKKLVEASMVWSHLYEEDELKEMMKELDKRNLSHEEIYKIKSEIEESDSINKTTNDTEIPSDDPEKSQKHKNGASWFYWIAGLSLINTVTLLADSQWNFPVGLGVTQIIDAIAVGLQTSFGKTPVYIALVLDILIAGVFVLFGKLANRKSNAAFILGMVIYSLDAIIILLFKDYVGFGFHVFALIFIFQGYKAIKDDKTLPPAPKSFRRGLEETSILKKQVFGKGNFIEFSQKKLDVSSIRETIFYYLLPMRREARSFSGIGSTVRQEACVYKQKPIG